MYAVSGVLAAAAGMAVGHLVAAFVNPAASPVLAVGSTVIDATPTPVKEWAVQNFGTKDKPILLGSVTLVVVLAAAAIGLVSRKKPSLANILVVALAALAGLAAWFRPASAPFDVVPAFVTAIVGVITITGLRSLIPNLPTPGAVTATTGKARGEGRQGRGQARVAAGPHGIREGVVGHAGPTQLPPRRRRRHGRRGRPRHPRPEARRPGHRPVDDRPAHAAEHPRRHCRRASSRRSRGSPSSAPRSRSSTGSTPRWSSRGSTSRTGSSRSAARSTTSSPSPSTSCSRCR